MQIHPTSPAILPWKMGQHDGDLRSKPIRHIGRPNDVRR